MSKEEKQFVGAVEVELSLIKDEVLSDIDALAVKIINLATMNEDETPRKGNVCLGAMQKALGLIIAQYFHKKDMPMIVESMTAALRKNVELWKEINVE